MTFPLPTFSPATSLPAITSSYVTSAVTSTSATTYTYSSQGLGAADANRMIVVTGGGYTSGAARTISTVTVAGISATIIQQVGGSAASNGHAWIAIAAVPTGTTGDIVCTYSGAMVRMGIGVFRIVGHDAIAAGTSYTDTGTGNPFSVSASCAAGGALIGVSCMVFGSTAGTYTWSGVTERYDGAIGGAVTHSGGSDNFAAAQSGLTVSTTYSETPNVPSGMIVTAFR